MMVSLDQNGKSVHTVIIERIDRLARDLMVQETILDDMNKNDVSIISVTDGDLLEQDPTRKLVRQVLGAIAEYDKEMTVQKLRAARNRKRALKGKCEGRKSYLETDPELIAEIKRLRRKPRNGKRLSIKKCVEKLNTNGFTTSTGKPFTVSRLENVIYKSMR